MNIPAIEPLTDAQWGAALRWLLLYSMQPTRSVRVKRIGKNRWRMWGKMRVPDGETEEPRWWHRRSPISVERAITWAAKAAKTEDDVPQC